MRFFFGSDRRICIYHCHVGSKFESNKRISLSCCCCCKYHHNILYTLYDTYGRTRLCFIRQSNACTFGKGFELQSCSKTKRIEKSNSITSLEKAFARYFKSDSCLSHTFPCNYSLQLYDASAIMQQFIAFARKYNLCYHYFSYDIAMYSTHSDA